MNLEVSISAEFEAFSLQLEAGFSANGISAIFGPSGCGKTTLLRCIAGFQSCTGTIRFGDSTWLDSQQGINVAPHRRPVGYVFQEAHLFPHLDVSGNLAFAESRAVSSGKFTRSEIVDILALSMLLGRHVDELSGGERQRVALARTLLSQPDLLLLDEPMSALDHARKAELLPYIRTACSVTGIPALFVSHAIDEVAQLAQHTLVLDEGRLQTQGATFDVLEHPDLERLTGRLEAGSVLAATVQGYDEQFQLAQLSCENFMLAVPSLHSPQTGSSVNLYVRARDVSIALSRPAGMSVRNVVPGEVKDIRMTPDSPFAEVIIRVGEQLLHARITRSAVVELDLAVNSAVYALIKSVSFDQSS